MIINNYTYKNCGKIISLRLALIIPIDKIIKNKKLIYKPFKKFSLLRQFLLTNGINNIFLEVTVKKPNLNKPLCFYVDGYDIPNFLELE